MGINIRIPTPSERLTSNGLNVSNPSHALAASAKHSAYIVVVAAREMGYRNSAVYLL